MASTKKCDWCGEKIPKWQVIELYDENTIFNFCCEFHAELMRAHLRKIQKKAIDFQV